MNSLVSIILNCRNGEKYLDQALKSIKNQDYENWELIFFDNNSTDKSYHIFKNNFDERFKYFKSSEVLKLYKARNEALKNCNGDIISFLDCDDWWSSDYLSSRQKFFNDPNIDYFYNNVYQFNEKKKNHKIYNKFSLPDGNIYGDLCKKYFVVISGLIVKKKVFIEDGNFNEKFNIIGDLEFVMRIAKKRFAKSTQKPMVFYRHHDENYLKLNTEEFYSELKSWIEIQDINFRNNTNYFNNLLNFLKLNYEIKKRKRLNLLRLILAHKDIKQKIYLLIKFFIPLYLTKFLNR